MSAPDPIDLTQRSGLPAPGEIEGDGSGNPPICLVTAARVPVALRMVRLLRQAGYRVVAADSLPFTGCSAMGTADAYVRLPRMSDDPQRWIEALIACCRTYRIQYLMPTFEETFLVSEHRREIEAACEGIYVFSGDQQVMTDLCDKVRLLRVCAESGVRAPATVAISSPADLDSLPLDAWEHGCLLKPVRGFAGSGILLNPDEGMLRQQVLRHPGERWLLQELIPGETVCLHAVAHEGVIRAVTMYRQQYVYGPGQQAGIGFGCVYEPMEDPLVREAAARIIAHTRYTGHIGFDMLRHGENVYCVDANPRATAGMYLIELGPGWLEDLRRGLPVQTTAAPPGRDLTLMFTRLMWSPVQLVRTLAATSHCREVTHRWDAPLASLLVLLIYGYFQLASWLLRDHASLLIARDLSYRSFRETRGTP